MTNLFIIIGISLLVGVIIGLSVYYFVGKKDDCKDTSIIGTYPITYVGKMQFADPLKNTFGTTNAYNKSLDISIAFVVTGDIEKTVKVGDTIKMVRESPEPKEYVFIIRQIVEPNDNFKLTTIMFDDLKAVLGKENSVWNFVVRRT
jgi:hypothetical protein